MSNPYEAPGNVNNAERPRSRMALWILIGAAALFFLIIPFLLVAGTSTSSAPVVVPVTTNKADADNGDLEDAHQFTTNDDQTLDIVPDSENEQPPATTP